jgi:hypothetical protein
MGFGIYQSSFKLNKIISLTALLNIFAISLLS